MTMIKVNPAGINAMYGNVTRADSQCHGSLLAVSAVKTGLDWQIKAGSDIDERLDRVSKRLRKQENRLDDYKRILRDVEDEFDRTDRLLELEMRNVVLDIIRKTIKNSSSGTNGGKKGGPLKDLIDRIFDLPGNILATQWGLLEDVADIDADLGWIGGIAGGVTATYNFARAGYEFAKKRYGAGVACVLRGAKATWGSVKSFLAKATLKVGAKTATQGAKSALGNISFIGNLFNVGINAAENAQEYMDGDISKERAVGEFITESVIDIGLNVGLTVAIAAVCPPAAGFAPMIASAIQGGLDIASEFILGDDFGEVVSDAYWNWCGGVKKKITSIKWGKILS